MASEACCKPAPPAVDNAIGKEETVGGLPAYVTGSWESGAAVILVSDIYGYKSPLLRKLADKVAAQGYLVVVPDFLKGDPFTPKNNSNSLEGLREYWLPKHPPSEAAQALKAVVEDLKGKGIRYIGAVGFCWGGKVVALAGKDKLFNAIVQMHPSLADASDYEGLQSPIAVLAAPSDGVEKFIQILKARNDIEHFVKVYPGVEHGWTVRYDENDPEAVKKAEEAHTDMLAWLKKHVPTSVNSS
jgi:dienelactone hydrolase